MKFVPVKLSRTMGTAVLKAKKNSPHIFFAGGVLGTIGSTVLACRATLKLEDTLEDIHNELHDVKELKRNPDPRSGYPENQYYKDLMYVYGKSTIKLGRLYGPSLVVGAASIAALTGSHVQLTKRNTALTVTIAALSKAYDEYRIRVQEEIGAEREMALYRGLKDEKVTIDGEKKTVKVIDSDGYSPYGRFFDSNNANWTGNQELNRIFIQCQQNYANHLLHSRGHVFLNDVYDNLGFERTTEGAVVGWVLNGDGDNYIDFGLAEAWNKEFRVMSFMLDFNVDGVMYDKI